MRTDAQILVDFDRPPHPEYKRLKRRLKSPLEGDAPRYRLAFSLPQDLDETLYVAGYSIREYDLYPNTYVSTFEKSRALTVAEVEYICTHKKHMYTLIPEPLPAALPPPRKRGKQASPPCEPIPLPAVAPSSKPKITWLPVPAMRPALPPPADYYPAKITQTFIQSVE